MFKPVEVSLKFYDRLKTFDVKLDNIIDGGCHQGNWSKRIKEIYPDSNFYLIDAQDQYRNELDQIGQFYCVALGMRNEDRKFYFAQNKNKSTGSSLYKENSNVLFDEKTIPVKKLSDVVPDQKYDLIKLDVQGAELEIIEGSLDLFKKTKWVQLECPVFHNNSGSPKFEHYINYMANSGFRVFDIDSILYNYRLMAVDFLFVNKDMPAQLPTEGDKLIYNHHDTSA